MLLQTVYFITAGLATAFPHSAAELIIELESTESKVGDTIYFNCSTNLTSGEEIFWYHGSQYIYIGDAILDPYRGRFEIDRNASSGSHNLVIHSVEPSDAGEYSCVDDDGHGTKRSAELIVLDNDLDCQSNIQPDGVIGQNMFNIPPDEVHLTCTVTYRGNIPPEIEWKKIGDESVIKDSMITNITSTDRSILTLKLEGDISLDGSSFVCQTRKSKQKKYKCYSEIINVLYFVGGDTKQLNVVRGNNITCAAKKNTFSCISQWYHDNYTCPLSCDETITTHLLGRYMCTVKCNVRGVDHYFETLKVTVFEEPAPLQWSTVGKATAATVVPIVVVIILAIVVITAIGLRCWRRRKPKNIAEAIKFTIDFSQDLLVNFGEAEKQEYFEITGLDRQILINDYMMEKLDKFMAAIELDKEGNASEHLVRSQSEHL